jgi:hypothetical protein
LARPSSALIASGDPWRMTLRLPVFGTLVLAAVFFLVTAPVKETPSLFNHAPWLNDPFDTLISFMILLVPLIAVLCMPRLLLCRRSEPLPVTRIRDLLRGCRVLLAGVGLTLASEWVSVVIGDNRAAWNGATWLQVGALALLSAATAVVLISMACPGRPPRPTLARPPTGWLISCCWPGSKSAASARAVGQPSRWWPGPSNGARGRSGGIRCGRRCSSRRSWGRESG